MDTVTLTSASPTDFAGTFDVLLYDHQALPPQPFVTVTGSFRCCYD